MVWDVVVAGDVVEARADAHEQGAEHRLVDVRCFPGGVVEVVQVDVERFVGVGEDRRVRRWADREVRDLHDRAALRACRRRTRGGCRGVRGGAWGSAAGGGCGSLAAGEAFFRAAGFFFAGAPATRVAVAFLTRAEPPVGAGATGGSGAVGATAEEAPTSGGCAAGWSPVPDGVRVDGQRNTSPQPAQVSDTPPRAFV